LLRQAGTTRPSALLVDAPGRNEIVDFPTKTTGLFHTKELLVHCLFDTLDALFVVVDCTSVAWLFLLFRGVRPME
jgi:hypothetical protein